MGCDYGADIEDADIIGAELWESFNQGRLSAFGFLDAVGMADKALTRIVFSVDSVCLHHVYGAFDRISLTVNLVIGDDLSVNIEPHYRADAEHGRQHGGRAGHTAASAEILKLR